MTPQYIYNGPSWLNCIKLYVNDLWPNKKITVFRVTRPYLNLLVKPRIIFRFSGKNKLYAFWKAKCLSKCVKLYFFSRKKLKQKYVCLPYLNFSDRLPTTLFFVFGLGTKMVNGIYCLVVTITMSSVTRYLPSFHYYHFFLFGCYSVNGFRSRWCSGFVYSALYNLLSR